MSRRRINARDLSERFPFVVSIQVKGKLVCTGSIISKDAVVTAASCIPKNMAHRMPNKISVRIGTEFAEQYGKRLPAMHVEFHPRYESHTLRNNLAIIRLKLGNHGRNRKIRLDEGDSPLRSVQILGYGAGSEYHLAYKRLETASVAVVPLQECKNVFLRNFGTEANFCTDVVSTRRFTQCYGDLGAPAVTGDVLVGVATIGSPVCGHTPTVFSKISYHYRWILYIINQKWITQSSYLTSATPGHIIPSTLMFDDTDVQSATVLMYYDDDEQIATTTQPTESITVNEPFDYGYEEQPTTTQAAESANPMPSDTDRLFEEIRNILSILADPMYIVHDFLKEGNEDNKPITESDNDEIDDDFDKYFEQGKSTLMYKKHPLYNKSIIPIPGVHFVPTSTTRLPSTAFSRPDIGLPDWLPYQYIEDYIQHSEELDYYIKKIQKDKGIDGLFGTQRSVNRANQRARTRESPHRDLGGVHEITRGFLWDKNFRYLPKDSERGDFKKAPSMRVKNYRAKYLSKKSNIKSS
ncbi:uncharacterized protein LOC128679581 [Plodia interpunctella]|uniref:uncharacterized protein LOC128679581 n=1 Tax=Plodia interpunctella TaxID=58824 RepID=UPI00310134E2